MIARTRLAAQARRAYAQMAVLPAPPVPYAAPLMQQPPQQASTTASQMTTAELAAAMPSRSLCRLEEFYDAVLAEDLAILAYSHHLARPTSPHLRAIDRANLECNADFLARQQLKADLLRQEALATRGRASMRAAATTATGSTATTAKKGGPPPAVERRYVAPVAPAQPPVQLDTRYQRYLAPRAIPASQLQAMPPVYERLPQLRSITVSMRMQQAVSHSRRVLQYGLLALQLVTGQQARIFNATESDARLRIREGMPVGVEVQLNDTEHMYAFVEKLVEQVLPKVRDFPGFSRLAGTQPSSDAVNNNNTSGHGDSTGGQHGSTISLQLAAETWTAFPEMEQTYLKFPQAGNVGCLQDFTVHLNTTAKSAEDARLLLSGFRLPFVYDEPLTPLVAEPEPEFVHEI